MEQVMEIIRDRERMDGTENYIERQTTTAMGNNRGKKQMEQMVMGNGGYYRDGANGTEN